MKFDKVMDAGAAFTEVASSVERSFRNCTSTIPTPDMASHLTEAYWHIWRLAGAYEQANMPSDFKEERSQLMRTIGPVLWKSTYYARSYFKPNGISGDFGIIEMMYDLENQPLGTPFQSGLNNCLDYSFSTIHSVVAIWERRKWLANRLIDLHSTNSGLQILDMPSGGARYVADFLERSAPKPSAEIWLIDQDAAALSYVRHRFAAKYPGIVSTARADILDFASVIEGRKFDVIISAGMFDYLSVGLAKRIVRRFAKVLAPNGRFLLTNYHRNDPSRLCKEWGADWPLVFRNEAEIRALFSDDWNVVLSLSQNGCLIMCEATRRS